ncbi:MAG: hypothetical protein V4456_14270 [Bacteroidota bacterium]|jgi:hypothetical protein|uniref:hypothetical protein n=1 Tax=Mucilaginibacter inviolabilis TaxID=2714892 RepID=UPI00140B4725|nr:hypothetical protein [Mucilaginibacter inviolabilis]NHA05843.1 hypothetical protein [Mucilaginibacter inviolabilis]
MSETNHELSPEYFNQLLTTKFTNDQYEINFEKNTPNVLTITFKHRTSGEEKSSDVGLQKNDKGELIVTMLNYKLYFQLIAPNVYSSFVEKIVAGTEEFITILNDQLVSVTDDTGIVAENNKRYLNIKDVSDYDDIQAQ